MLSKNDIKLITRLKQKKYRTQDGLFVVEGLKVIHEFLKSSFQLQQLYTTVSFGLINTQETIISEAELKKISFLNNPNKALAVFNMKAPQVSLNDKGLIVALDEVNDPGNLGTIIRLCDWFGVKQLVCSTNTVDCFNPKVLQSTMGSLTRVSLCYTDLQAYLKQIETPIFGTFMDGENVYANTLPKEGVLVMGNEANGISKEIEVLVTKKIAIPRFGPLQATESLNVATATAILLSEFYRA